MGDLEKEIEERRLEYWLEMFELTRTKQVFSFEYKGDWVVDGELSIYRATTGRPFNLGDYVFVNGEWVKNY